MIYLKSSTIIDQNPITYTYACLVRKNVYINHLKTINTYWLLLNSTPYEQNTDFMKLHKRIFL